MSTRIIYNPRLGEESRTSRIRRSRKRPLGEATSSPSSILVRKIRRWRCGCVVAAACIFSSATGQKPCTIPAQQHRPRGSPNQREAASPAELQQVQRLFSLSRALSPYPSLSVFFFFPPSTPQGDVSQHAVGPEAVYSRGDQPWKRRNPTSGALLRLSCVQSAFGVEPRTEHLISLTGTERRAQIRGQALQRTTHGASPEPPPLQPTPHSARRRCMGVSWVC